MNRISFDTGAVMTVAKQHERRTFSRVGRGYVITKQVSNLRFRVGCAQLCGEYL